MTRFNEITYDANASSVTVGSGNTWNPVYEALAPHSVNVVGGRIQNIGVVGFILGGGEHLSFRVIVSINISFD